MAAQGYIVGADTRGRAESYTGYLRQHAAVAHREAATVDHRELGGGAENSTQVYLYKITGGSSGAYNVSLYTSKDGDAVGTAVLMYPLKHISESMPVDGTQWGVCMGAQVKSVVISTDSNP